LTTYQVGAVFGIERETGGMIFAFLRLYQPFLPVMAAAFCRHDGTEQSHV
jgi:hypothetical protein